MFAAIAGLALFGEPITRETVIGFLVLLVGFVLIAHELVLEIVGSTVDRV